MKVESRIAAIVLGAGESRRMGQDNKLLIPVDGKPMIVHAVTAACGSKAGPVIVVTGHHAETVGRAVKDFDITLVHAEDYADGLSRSLVRGLEAVPVNADGVIVCLGDMPRIRSAHIDRLINAFEPGAICVAEFEGQRGNPVLLDRRYFDEMKDIEGDSGARHLIRRFDASVREVSMDDAAPLIDVDRREDLARI